MEQGHTSEKSLSFPSKVYLMSPKIPSIQAVAFCLKSPPRWVFFKGTNKSQIYFPLVIFLLHVAKPFKLYKHLTALQQP